MTIFALSSGHGKAGVAVLRVSGPQTSKIVQLMAGTLPAPRYAALRSLRSPHNKELLDKGLVLWFPCPHSFTGEDMAEFHVHGGKAVIEAMLISLGQAEGLRFAEPGEFTRRAFHNGKLDLTEAEGLADLIDAETSAQRQQAIRQSSGALSKLYESWRSDLISAMALVEAHLDFSDEDSIPDDMSAEISSVVVRISSQIVKHLQDGRSGERLREGLKVVIAGSPNVGKSSLLNALAKRDVAIVSEEAGTTRDIIEVHMDLGGYPVILMDTAGVREAPSAVEREGVRRTLSRAEEADLVLWLYDPCEGVADLPPPPSPFINKLVLVSTKSDLCLGRPTPHGAISISSHTGEGVPELITRLQCEAQARIGLHEEPLITRSRHRQGLECCQVSLARYLAGDFNQLELRAEDLREAATALGRITGRVDVEDVLDKVFSGFCIGK
jgi:tRNA modification GTPase